MSYHGDPGLPAGSPPSDRENEEFERQTECEVCGASDPQWCDPAKHGYENSYAMLGRAAKVSKLVAALRDAGVSASMAREADPASWTVAAVQAGVRMPSARTIAAVIAELEKQA